MLIKNAISDGCSWKCPDWISWGGVRYRIPFGAKNDKLPKLRKCVCRRAEK